MGHVSRDLNFAKSRPMRRTATRYVSNSQDETVQKYQRRSSRGIQIKFLARQVAQETGGLMLCHYFHMV